MGKAAPRESITTFVIDINSPAGESGPGYFSQAYSLTEGGLPSLSPAQPKGPAAGMWVAQAKTPTTAGGTTAKKNPPPATKAATTKVKKESTSTKDIDIKVEVKADGSDSSLSAKSAKTSFSFSGVNWNAPGYDPTKGGKITNFKGKFTFKGTITIQTKYGSSAKATDTSLYGRGTTKNDKKNGDITLGFHENCHQKDYLSYLKNNALPTMDLKVGMTPKEYKQAIAKFEAAYKKYQKDMKDKSNKDTDEVGYKLSKCKADKKC